MEITYFHVISSINTVENNTAPRYANVAVIFSANVIWMFLTLFSAKILVLVILLKSHMRNVCVHNVNCSTYKKVTNVAFVELDFVCNLTKIHL